MGTLGALNTAANETALFAEHMEELFNTFNKQSECAFSESSSYKEFLHNTLWLESLQSGSSQKLISVAGWKISFRSLLQLWEELHITQLWEELHITQLWEELHIAQLW